MDAGNGIWAFYYIQGEDGEDRSHPNAFKVPAAGDVTLADVQRHFPLKDPAAFHFRFRINGKSGAGGSTFYWLDVTAPNQKVPLVNGRVICKLLRLARPQKVGVVFKRKPVLKWANDKARHGSGNLEERVNPKTSVQPIARQSSANTAPQRRPKYSDAPASAPAKAAAPSDTRSGAASAGSGDNGSAGSSRTGSGSSGRAEPTKDQTSPESFEDFLSGGSAPASSASNVNLMSDSGWNSNVTTLPKQSSSSSFMSSMDPLAPGSSGANAARRPPPPQARTEQPKFEDDGGQTVGPVSMADMKKHCTTTSDGSNVYNAALVDKSTKSADVRRAMEERERQMQMDVEKAREELRQREEATRQLAAQKESLNTTLGPKLKAWAEDNGRTKNIRTLLSTMHQVMWEDSKWAEVNMGKLIQPNDVKKHYRKAMIVVHPDKSGGRNAEQLLIAERVFAAVNTAWEEFIKTNPC
ncbi:TPA: hypothetical protein N0F65_002466 [Lagenidium giganteum]|uniref:DIX domain-containing protein n=1 Tax=Lagenidium giganteum TaxID=4803 RepID=A0AAV2YSQ9_9STRA|nr:TPA: hypothetical protein N0F65_002466 [Lagenidium giganteum]